MQQSINVASYSGFARVYFKFEFTPGTAGSGNNVFIDDINLGMVVGIEEQVISDGIEIFPNPASDHVIVKCGSLNNSGTILLYDISMRLLKETRSEGSEVKIDVQHLPAGIYFLKAQTIKGNKTFRLIKQ
jgi:hypothetical protein